ENRVKCLKHNGAKSDGAGKKLNGSENGQRRNGTQRREKLQRGFSAGPRPRSLILTCIKKARRFSATCANITVPWSCRCVTRTACFTVSNLSSRTDAKSSFPAAGWRAVSSPWRTKG